MSMGDIITKHTNAITRRIENSPKKDVKEIRRLNLRIRKCDKEISQAKELRPETVEGGIAIATFIKEQETIKVQLVAAMRKAL